MDDLVCDKCKRSFSSKYTLTRHRATAVYCSGFLSCKYCSFKTKRKDNLNVHIEVCREEYIAQKDKTIENLNDHLTEKDKTIESLGEQLTEKDKTLNLAKTKIKMLKKEIGELKLSLAEDNGQIKVYKERPGNVTNNQYVNKLLQVKCDTIRPFTIETVREDVKDGKYTFDKFIQAEKGLLEFISDIIAQDDQRSYVCTDSSRQRFHRLLESREWKDDNGATFLNKVLDELKEPATEYFKRVANMLVNGDRDTAEFLIKKTKPMAMGITCAKSKDRDNTFNKIRNEVKKLATI